VSLSITTIGESVFANDSRLDHPYFVGLQAHPEFCTRPLNPSPPFLGFIAAAASADTLLEQLRSQSQSYVSPHPKGQINVSAVLPGTEE